MTKTTTNYKVLSQTTKAVRVLDKDGNDTFLPTSKIDLNFDKTMVTYVPQWLIEIKDLATSDTIDILSDDLFGDTKSIAEPLATDKYPNLEKILTGTIVESEKIVVNNGVREYKRKIHSIKSGKKAGLRFFNLKTNVYAFNQSGIMATDIKWIANYKDGTSIGELVKQIEEDTTIDIKVPFDASKPVNHEETITIKTCIENDLPVYLHGPAGSGKNHTLQMIADDLGLEFFFTNSVQQEFKITGFIDAGGKYHETEFYKAFTNGGLFFLDEMDASIPEVLVLLNAAIANRYFEFPNGRVDAHEDFRVVAAGNTIGSGADENYTGRLVLDQATLDRFVTIEFNYDRNIEMFLAKGNEELVDFVRILREKCEDQGIRGTYSYRCITSVQRLEATDSLKLEKIILIAVVKGLDQDTLNTLRDWSTSNKYWKALNKLAA